MENKKDEFYVGYNNNVPKQTGRLLKKTVWIFLFVIIIFVVVFSYNQNPFNNGSFELTKESKVTGVYHESPYPMLRVQLGKNTYKNILLLGFGKFGAKKYINELEETDKDILNKEMTIDGNLIYYNGKTLLQISDEQNIIVHKDKQGKDIPLQIVDEYTLEGEIVDPKCYFGVMKPGKGKIHRSCAVRCISGGIPPVFASTDVNNVTSYFLITDMDGNPVNKEVLPYVGQPARIRGLVEKYSDSWFRIKIDANAIELLNKKSTIY
ncbi:hypothetical protein [Tenacibaculum amylolyticum]|uniref:hypothetical protein n=1 Tax=Tenacibaculum amylolyticum TaxID=104269 RepID=UPI003894D4C3